MTTIKIVERFGPFVSSRGSARELRNEIVGLATSTGERIELDFAGVESISDSFSDELIAVLVKLHGPQWVLDHVRIVNLGAEDRRDVERVVERRAGPVSVALAFG
jgi:hypothetical protein